MKENKDAYGQEVLAYLRGEKSFEVVEREDGYTDVSSGAPAYFAEYKDWSQEEKLAIKYARGRCIDIGAGAGRVSLFLQKKGHDVTAIDNSPLAIKVCKQRGVRKAKLLPIEQIKELAPESFDTVVMFGNNFGLFGSFRKAGQLLKKLHKITSPRARIIAASANIYNTIEPAHLAYHKLNRSRGRMSGQVRLRIRFKQYASDWFDYLIVSKDEMKEILTNTGWRVKKFIDSRKFVYIAVIEKD